MIRGVVLLFCCICAASAYPAVIAGPPVPELPSPGSQAVLTPPIPIGPDAYLLPIDLLSLDVSEPAFLHYTTDGLPGATSYLLPISYSNRSNEDWDSFSIELLVEGDNTAVTLSVQQNRPSIKTLFKVSDTLLVDDVDLAVNGSRPDDFFINLDGTPPTNFSLKFTPIAVVPEPGSAVACLLLAVTCRRRRNR